MQRDPTWHPDACPEMWYAIAAEEDHFWIQSRFLAFLRLIEETSACPERSPIGGWTSVVAGAFSGGSWNPRARGSSTGRMSIPPSAFRGPGTWPGVSAGHHGSSTGLREQYDLLLVFDVLEHLADERSFLDSLPHYLRPGGTLFLHVPALPLFFSTYDRAVGHLRRYGAGALEQLVGAIPGLSVRVSRYWGASLMPLLGIRKVIGVGDPDQIIRRGFRPPNSLVNMLVGGSSPARSVCCLGRDGGRQSSSLRRGERRSGMAFFSPGSAAQDRPGELRDQGEPGLCPVLHHRALQHGPASNATSSTPRADCPEMDIRQIRQAAANLAEIGVCVVLLIGGEPFVRTDLPEIVRAFTDHDIHVRLETNGLATRRKIEMCVDAGAHASASPWTRWMSRFRTRSMDWHGAGTGRSGPWRTSTRSSPNGARASSARVLMPRSLNDVPAVVEFASRIGWGVSLVPCHTRRLLTGRSGFGLSTTRRCAASLLGCTGRWSEASRS